MSGQTEIMWGEEVLTNSKAPENGEYELQETEIGLLNSTWEVKPFEWFLQDNGLSYGVVQPGDDKAEGIPIIRAQNISGGKVLLNGIKKIDAKIESQYARTRLKGDELLITVVGSLGDCVITDKSLKGFNVARAVAVARFKDVEDRAWLKYCFQYGPIKAEIGNVANTTVQPTLNLKELRQIPFPVPSPLEKNAIVAVLSSLDDKIDLLHRQNATLEALAETLFRQWFVEEAKEEWEDGAISDIIDFNPTYRLRKGELATYLEMSNVSSSTFNPSGWYKREFNSGTKFKNGDTLLARITPCLENGKTAYVSFLEEDEIGWGSTEYIIMRMKPQFHPFLSYVIARNSDFRDFAISSMSGSSGRQRVQTDMLAGYDIKIPDKVTIQKMNEQLESISSKLIANAPQIETLSALRDTLLPKLMSGEVRVAY